jgi:hypothetical protein
LFDSLKELLPDEPGAPPQAEIAARLGMTEASGGTAPGLQTGGKGVWSNTTDSNYAFRFKDFTCNSLC